MKLFIWKQVGECGSGSYHPEGGLVIIAQSLPAALEAAKAEGAVIKDDETPDEVRDIEGPAGFWRFPDAGCC